MIKKVNVLFPKKIRHKLKENTNKINFIIINIHKNISIRIDFIDNIINIGDNFL